MLKKEGQIKEGASKYKGVTFHKAMNKWMARIKIDGKRRLIGFYENEEEAAADYARVAFKYKGQGAPDKGRKRKKSKPATDIPPQPSILGSAEQKKAETSKHQQDEAATAYALHYARRVFNYKDHGLKKPLLVMLFITPVEYSSTKTKG